MLNVAIIGAGALGTALAQSLSKNLDNVYLYARRQKVVDDINNLHYNKDYYPNVKLNENIQGINEFGILSDADCVVLTIPSSNLREIMKHLVEFIPKDCLIVSTIKGIEKSTSKTASDIIKEIAENPVAILSGPNIAREIVLNLPAATTIAIDSKEFEDPIREIFESDEFKLQFNFDPIGTEFCGVLKNILAISTGICDGLNINDSAKFAVLNKGFVEIQDIIVNLGGQPDTILNYCGFGDMVTASTLTVSRNHTLGQFFGQKIVIDENKTGIVFEGKNSIKSIKKLCDEKDMDSAIVDFVYDVIINKINPEYAFEQLWRNL